MPTRGEYPDVYKRQVPQFAALGKQYENKRLNKAPFFMYGEVCTRGHEATYSCLLYTSSWKGRRCVAPDSHS